MSNIVTKFSSQRFLSSWWNYDFFDRTTLVQLMADHIALCNVPAQQKASEWWWIHFCKWTRYRFTRPIKPCSQQTNWTGLKWIWVRELEFWTHAFLWSCSRRPNYTVSQKKQDTKLLAVTSPTIIRFSNFFSLADSVVNLQQTYV